MSTEILVIVLTAGVALLGYIAKTLHSMDKNLAVIATKLEVHETKLIDHEARIRNFEIN